MLGTYDRATIRVLILRDLKRFLRQGSRVAGAVLQPLLFWIILGSGFASSFQMSGGTNYRAYFFPGVVSMMVLFSALFSTMSIIEDRNSGFLQGVLTGPAHRSAMVLGKILGGTVVSLIQVALFVALAPLAGYSYAKIHWVWLAFTLFISAFSLNAFGFFLAWALNSVQGYHAIMMVILMPLWLISGAFFPIQGASPWLGMLMKFNPMTYSVEAIRQTLGGSVNGVLTDIGVIATVAAASFALATRACRKSRAV